jgi:hypothetical protein
MAQRSCRHMTPAGPARPLPRGSRHPIAGEGEGRFVRVPLLARAAVSRQRYPWGVSSSADRVAWPTRGAGPEGTAGVIWRSEAVARMKAHWDAPSPRRNPVRPAPARLRYPMRWSRATSGYRSASSNEQGPVCRAPPRRWRIPICFHAGDSKAAPDDASRPFGSGSPRGPRQLIAVEGRVVHVPLRACAIVARRRYPWGVSSTADRVAWPTRGAGPEGTAGVIWRSEAVARMKADGDAPLPRTNPVRTGPARLR